MLTCEVELPLNHTEGLPNSRVAKNLSLVTILTKYDEHELSPEFVTIVTKTTQARPQARLGGAAPE